MVSEFNKERFATVSWKFHLSYSTDHLYDLLQYKAELNVGGLRQVDDGTWQTVVIARVEQLREQSVFRRVSAHTCMRTHVCSNVYL